MTLTDLLDQRIAVLDGAWGTMLQGARLTPADYRGDLFRDHPRDVTGDPEMATVIAKHKTPRAEVLGGVAARLLWTLVRHEAEMQKHVLNSEKLARMVKDGITNYVVKPVGAEPLIDAVASAMERREIYKL